MRADSLFRSAPRSAVGLGLLALLASGPFLWPFHSPPIGSFWNEWWAGALGLAAATVFLADRRRDLPLPALLCIPAVMLLAMLLQFALGRLAFPQIGLLYAAYLLWAGLLLILGRHMAEGIGLARLAGVLAWGFALGALAGSVIALIQWRGAGVGAWWIAPGGVYGNLGQINHHAHYSWLGIASLFYLRGRGWLSRPLFWLVLLPIVMGSVLGGSRAVVLYPLILLASILWARHQTLQGPTAGLLADAVLLLPAVVVLSMLGFWAAPAGPGTGVTSVSRLYQAVEGSSVRMALAGTAWAVFLEHPWLGEGAGNYPWASFLAAAGRAGGEPFMVAENAHNFILQCLAEFGAPTTALVMLLLVLWARRFVARPWGLEEVWCGAVLGIGATHALLEYPLWYAYFLGPAALLLGATSSGGASLPSSKRVALYVGLVALAGLSILNSLRIDYAAIEAAAVEALGAGQDRERSWKMTMEPLKVLHRESLLSPWVLLAFAGPAEPSRQQIELRVTLCERVIRFQPARSLLTRCAMQLAIAGRDADAQNLVGSTMRAFPAERTMTVDELAKGASDYPEIQPLWRLSLR
jgi:hypothetical protein